VTKKIRLCQGSPRLVAPSDLIVSELVLSHCPLALKSKRVFICGLAGLGLRLQVNMSATVTTQTGDFPGWLVRPESEVVIIKKVIV